VTRAEMRNSIGMRAGQGTLLRRFWRAKKAREGNPGMACNRLK
jgi:hypothetical protein